MWGRGTLAVVLLGLQAVLGQLLLSDEERGEEISRAVNELMLESINRPQRQEPEARHGDHEHHHHHTHITRLDVTCDDSGMRVNLEFDHPFDGVVFSKGHYGNPNCRHVGENSGRGDFTFHVDVEECGTLPEERRSLRDCPDCDPRETILVVQNEEAVQEIWDSARRVRCPHTTAGKITKSVAFNPLEIARLEVQEEEPRARPAEVECWMNIQRGETPFGRVVDGRVKIGEQLTAVVYIKDGGAQYDIKVKDCFAHDRADLLEHNVTKLRLSDERGCPTKKKLMGFFTRTSDTGSTGADLIAFAPISAFKFADRTDVYLTCVVELCPGGCEDHCPLGSDALSIEVPPPPPPPPVTTPRTTTTVRTTTQFVCTPGSRDARCPTPPTPTQREPVRTTPPTTTTQFVCTPRSRDPRCPAPPTPTQREPVRITPPTTTTQFVCTPRSRDPRCPTAPPPTQREPVRTTPPTTTTQFVCTPRSRDPRCPAPPTPTQREPVRTTPPTTTTRFVCTPGSRDSRCPAPPAPTPPPFRCTPDSDDPRCVQRPNCDTNPSLEGCSAVFKDRETHAFHAWQLMTPRGMRRRYDGSRRNFASQRRRREAAGKPITLTVSTGFHL